MEIQLDDLLSNLINNQITDPQLFEEKLRRLLVTEALSPKASSLFIIKILSSEHSLLVYLLTQTAPKDRVAVSIKRSILQFLAKLSKIRPDLLSDRLGHLAVD